MWFAAAEKALANVRIEPIQSRAGQTSVVSASVPAAGARLFPIRLPGPSRLVLGVNGSPFMQMTVFAADGSVLEARGPLRVVTIERVTRTPVQLLLTNDGLAPAMVTLSLRPDPLPPASPAPAAPQPQPPSPLLEPPAEQPAEPPAASNDPPAAGAADGRDRLN